LMLFNLSNIFLKYDRYCLTQPMNFRIPVIMQMRDVQDHKMS